MNKKFIISAAVFLVLSILLNSIRFYSPIDLSIEVKGFEPGLYELQYSGPASNGKVQQNMPQLRRTDFIKRLKQVFVPEYDLEFIPLYFALPAKYSLHHFQIQLPATNTVIRSVCLSNRFGQHCWRNKEISQIFAVRNGTMINQNGFISVQASGQNKAVLVYRAGNFDALYRNFQVEDRPKVLGMHILALFFCLLLYVLWNKLERWRLSEPGFHIWQAQNAFLALGSLFGILILITTPPFQVSDESRHFGRALHLSQGHLFLEQHQGQSGYAVPATAVATALELVTYYSDAYEHGPFFNEKSAYFLDVPLHTFQTRFVNTDMLYPPISYLPQSAGIGFAGLLNLSWLESVYLGRLANMLVWIACIYIAIIMLPVGRWLMALLALSPVTIFQSVSLSPDSMTIGLAFLLISLSLRFALTKVQYPKRLFTAMLVLLLLIILSKQPYIFLGLLFFMVPCTYFGGPRNYLSLLTGVFILGSGALLVWLYHIEHAYTVFTSVHGSSERLEAILQNPIKYIGVLIHTGKFLGADLISSFIGRLGGFDVWKKYQITLPMWIIWTHGLMLLFYALTDGRYTYPLSISKRLIMLGVSLIGVFLIFTGLYFASTPVDSPFIVGLQGRYFIPMAMLPLLLLYNRYLSLKPEFHALLTLAYVPFVLTLLLFVIFFTYYNSISFT